MRKFSDWVIFLAFGCLTFFHLKGFYTASGEYAFSEEKACFGEEALSVVSPLGFERIKSRQHLLFFIDFRDFACLNCLDSFLGLYRQLPPRFQSEDAIGVLVLNSGGDEEKSFQIARVKLRGFVLSNRIEFPVQVDRFHVFREFVRDGTSVVLLDYDREIIRKFLFPLRQDELDELLGCLRIE